MKNVLFLFTTALVIVLAGCNRSAVEIKLMPSPSPVKPSQSGPGPMPASNSNYVNVIRDVAMNSALEMGSLGKAEQDFGKNKDYAAFTDFMDSDAVMWGTFVMQVEATHPTDASLQATQSTILIELKNMKAEAIKIRDAANSRDVHTALVEARKALVVSDHIKQQYQETLSQ
jgi:hypothetical protein